MIILLNRRLQSLNRRQIIIIDTLLGLYLLQRTHNPKLVSLDHVLGDHVDEHLHLMVREVEDAHLQI